MGIGVATLAAPFATTTPVEGSPTYPVAPTKKVYDAFVTRKPIDDVVLELVVLPRVTFHAVPPGKPDSSKWSQNVPPTELRGTNVTLTSVAVPETLNEPWGAEGMYWKSGVDTEYEYEPFERATEKLDAFVVTGPVPKVTVQFVPAGRPVSRNPTGYAETNTRRTTTGWPVTLTRPTGGDPAKPATGVRA